MNVLVIDDSRAMRTILSGILKAIGFEVFEAADGKEGLSQMEAVADVALALVDWNMPEMNGFEFVQAVRALDDYSATKLMMVTTETEMDQVVMALDAGADEYVMKPFTRDVIMEKLELLGISLD
ncbi:MAG: response regulator [bacterium]|nr:response regulator [Planctomycetota bacterium]HIL53001.1 response regulator [Planctomycetota bacterium]